MDEKRIPIFTKGYTAGFETEVETHSFAPGLNETVIRELSTLKGEPPFILEWRLKAYTHWLTLTEPHWSTAVYPAIDYQKIAYYSAPKNAEALSDPTLLETYQKLGIPLEEQKRFLNVAVDAVFDSVSVATTFQKELASLGIIFCSMKEAIQQHPELIQKYLGSVVPYQDNFYACLNSAVFSDGTFCYIPPNVTCPLELSTYFRINAPETGQFERTLIIADKGSKVSYLEGCTAPIRDINQLHAAVVELIALEGASIKYSTLQNWYPGDSEGKGGIYNFVTKRGECREDHSKIAWIQLETGAAITWKYPSVILRGDHSAGEFFSVALTRHHQQADTGTKMIHLGKHTKSTVISKGICADHGKNTFRGLISIRPNALEASNYTQCDSLLLGPTAIANTLPSVEVHNATASAAHEATTTRIQKAQSDYLQQRGFNEEEARALIVHGFCKSVLSNLPMEFALEAQKLLNMQLEGTTG